MRAMMLRLFLVFPTFALAAGPAAAEVKVTRVTCLGTPGCIRLANDTVELVITTAIGPRVIRYAFLGGDNLLGEVPDLVTTTAFGGRPSPVDGAGRDAAQLLPRQQPDRSGRRRCDRAARAAGRAADRHPQRD